VKKPPVSLLLSTEVSDRAVRFTATVVTENEEGKVRNILADWSGDPLFGLADLAVTAQADTDNEGAWYAAKVEYRNVYSLDLAKAEANVKVLRKVKRTFEAEGEDMKWGRDLETTLRLAAKALGAKGFLVELGSDGTGRWGYDGRRYGTIDAAAAADWANARLAEARGVTV